MRIFLEWIELTKAERQLKAKFKGLSQNGDAAALLLTWGTEIRDESLVQLVKDVEDSENKRREGIESKANVLIAASATSMAFLLAFTGALLSEPASRVPSGAVEFIHMCLLFTAVSWSSAGWCALKTTQITGLRKIAAQEVSDFFNAKSTTNEVLANRIANTQANESLLLVKTNYLQLAQKCFTDGIIAMFLAFILRSGSYWYPQCLKCLASAKPLLMFSTIVAAAIGGQCLIFFLIFLALKGLKLICKCLFRDGETSGVQDASTNS